MTIYNIVLDGIDKTGKDTIRQYIFHLGNAKYICTTRGYISMVAYSKLFNRDYDYDIENQKNTLNVLITADKADWEVRCKMTNEPRIDYDIHSKVFDEVFTQLRLKGYYTIMFNSSHHTPYEIAISIINYANKLNELQGGK